MNSLDALSVDIVRSARLSLTGGALNFHRRFPRLAMSGGFLRQLQSCGAHVQSTLRSSSFVSLNSLLLPSLGGYSFNSIFTSIWSLLIDHRADRTLRCLVVGGFFEYKKTTEYQWFIVRSDVLLSQGLPSTTIGAFLDLR